MRNVKTVNWTDNSQAKALANLGGGPRPTPKTDKGVPIYFHDWFGAGRHAMVVSVKSGEFKATPGSFREETPLTGDESRVAEVKDVPLPGVPAVVDDLPPATVITQRFQEGREALVRGTTTDNGTVKRVMVNGQEAKSTGRELREWEITLDAATELEGARRRRRRERREDAGEDDFEVTVGGLSYPGKCYAQTSNCLMQQALALATLLVRVQPIGSQPPPKTSPIPLVVALLPYIDDETVQKGLGANIRTTWKTSHAQTGMGRRVRYETERRPPPVRESGPEPR